MAVLVNVAMLIVGGLLGALYLDRRSRFKYGHSYSEEIRRDFDLQWDAIRHTALAHLQSPFSEHVQQLSPDCTNLFAEAQSAEKVQLSDVAGLGYAKSLELLIKDAAKAEHPDKSDAIEAAPLATCVRTYFSDELIRNSSELAVWLRNDQVHYKRKYTQHGAQELKGLIVLVASLFDELERRRKAASNIDSLRQAMKSTPPPAS